MNNQELNNAINNIRLPEESKERIIRNLEQINPDEYVFDAEPEKTPILRYMMTAIAACAVLAVAAVSMYISNRGEFTPASEINAVEEMEAVASEGFEFSESPLFAVMESYTSSATVTYLTMTDDQKTQLAEIFNSFDWENPDQEVKYVASGGDMYHLYFQYHDLWYSLRIITDEADQSSWIQWTCQSSSANSTATVQADGAVIEEIRSIINSTHFRTGTIYTDYWAAVNSTDSDFIELMCLDTAYNDILSLSKELNANMLNACFMMRKSDDWRNDAKYSGEYFVMTPDQKQEFSDLLLRQYLSDLHMEYMAGGRIFAVLYLENGTYLEFWEDSDCILIHNPESFPDETFSLDMDSALIEQFLALFESFKVDAERAEINHLNHETLMNQMFTSTAPFGDVSQMDMRIVFQKYYPSYVIPTDEQKQQLADLLNNFNYEKRVNRNQSYGESFSLWLDDHGERKEIKCFESGYIAWEEGIARYTYEAEELIQEIRNLFPAVDIVYITNGSGDMFDTPKDQIEIDYSDHDLSEYLEVMDEYNQEHPDYQLRIDDAALDGEPYAVTRFLYEYPTPEAFKQSLIEIYEKYASDGLNFNFESD